jgi:hypothetical protein
MTFRNCALKRRNDVRGRNAAVRDDAVKKLLDEVLERVTQDQKPQAEIREVCAHQLAEYRAKAEARAAKYKRTPRYRRAIGWTLGIGSVIGFFWLAAFIGLYDDPELVWLKAMVLGTLVCFGIAFLVNR